MMLPFRPIPAQCEDTVKPLPFPTMISKKGDIGYQREVKINGAGDEIDTDAGDIPEQGRFELSILDDVEHPVRPSQIHQYIPHAKEEDEHGDYFCGSGDRPPPFCFGKAKDG